MGNDLDSLIGFVEAVARLKREKRKGWVERGVRNAESVAEHCFVLAVMALVLARKLGLDECRAVKLAIVHDLPEALAGDTVTRIREELQDVPNREKHAREEKALGELCGMLDRENAEELRALWLEFEERKSKEARLVYELDRLEAIFQALEYERKGNFRVSLQEFYDYANARLEMPETRAVFGRLMGKRAEKGR
jgi:putative hydrolase of HD superfamily